VTAFDLSESDVLRLLFCGCQRKGEQT